MFLLTSSVAAQNEQKHFADKHAGGRIKQLKDSPLIPFYFCRCYRGRRCIRCQFKANFFSSTGCSDLTSVNMRGLSCDKAQRSGRHIEVIS